LTKAEIGSVNPHPMHDDGKPATAARRRAISAALKRG
jgi:hypothetical protein